MPGQHKDRDEGYNRLFQRLEESFDPEELDAETIEDYINANTPGMRALAEELSRTKVISDEIEELEDISKLKSLRKEARSLEIHRREIQRKIEEKIVALSITTTESFAKERRIVLSEKVTGRIETWSNGKKYLVIRERGSFRAWKII